MTNSADVHIHHRACHLCEAVCELLITTQGHKIVSIKGDPDDPLSRGHICPKGVALQDVHQDPDRLRTPVKRVVGASGEIKWQPIPDLEALWRRRGYQREAMWLGFHAAPLEPECGEDLGWSDQRSFR